MKDNKPLISVIVPVYMIDRYVGLCIESIINQAYKNLEIILVDDGSKDRCPEICDLYQRKDSRIKVVHKTNGGLVSARKIGLQQSNGKYISYVDGDDWVGPGFIEELYIAASTNDADMVCAGFTRDLFSKSVCLKNTIPSGIYEGDELRNLWKSMLSYKPYYRTGISTYVWNKLFKREVLLDSQLQVDNRISIGEDGAVTYPTLLKCKKVIVIDNVDYHYRQREDSMLKQNAIYSFEAQKLLYLYEYLKKWAKTTEEDLNIRSQIIDYVLSIAVMRSGGRLSNDNYSVFDSSYFNKKVVIYSAGTFGQQLMNRIKETKCCDIVAWIDDDYWEYRRCCLDVDSVESISGIKFDYILIATVDSVVSEKVMKRLVDLGVSKEKMLTINVKEGKEQLLSLLLDVETIKRNEEKNKQGVTSHA